ncbi:MAG TPA: hypothetical protein VED01_19170 [Burkholderiales bacterium]|nr:hypothetical protein [Burkholderiales bacterium]
MATLSPAYTEIRRLRSRGDCAGAIRAMRSHAPMSEEDAFEGVVCLFVCGDAASALNVCRTWPWKKEWAAQITGALAEMLTGGDAAKAVERARRALTSAAAPYDASAIYLMLLQHTGALGEAGAYMRQRLEPLPMGEPFLLTIMAETALTCGDWRQAYRCASAVLAHDPDDYRALIAASQASLAIGNTHEALGAATRAAALDMTAPAVLQIMRCQNKLGDHYAALGAFGRLAAAGVLHLDIRMELAKAYAGVGERAKAIAEYHALLGEPSPSVAALAALLELHAFDGEDGEIEALLARHRGLIERDFTSLYWVGISALHRGDRAEAARVFAKTRELAPVSPQALHAHDWPIPEPRLRHDFEQLQLLERRGKLDASGRQALALLARYHDPRAGIDAKIAPAGGDADALKAALSRVHHLPAAPFEGRALGENDYAAIEERYRRERLVAIDGFLCASALDALRRFSEEATVWNAIYNRRGYVGAVLAQGFAPEVLLAIAEELRRAMPNVIGDLPLIQAWGFKYDQRMQGINMHADFARVNVNFWLVPDDACEDLTTGGLIVYDVPVPKSWTFTDYNSEPERLNAYVTAHGVTPRRIPYRGNRCVLFDSSLIHVTDELHFKPGYENRRVNVTLLYGKGLSA